MNETEKLKAEIKEYKELVEQLRQSRDNKEIIIQNLIKEKYTVKEVIELIDDNRCVRQINKVIPTPNGFIVEII